MINHCQGNLFCSSSQAFYEKAVLKMKVKVKFNFAPQSKELQLLQKSFREQ